MNARTAKANRRQVAASNGKASARSTRASSKAKTKTPTEVSSVEESTATPVNHPAIIIVRVPTQEGNWDLQIACVNGMDPFAVPTLLRKAIQIQETNLGLERN